MARGRPGKKDEICNHKADIEKWAAEGLTMGQIAKKLGVSESTLYKYKAELPELSETVKKGRNRAEDNYSEFLSDKQQPEELEQA